MLDDDQDGLDDDVVELVTDAEDFVVVTHLTAPELGSVRIF